MINYIISLVLLISSAAFAQNIKVAVMDLTAKAGIDAMKTGTLTDVLCTQISDLGGYDVIGRDDMKAMLAHVADKQTLDCDDTKCLAKVGGALGVDRLLAGNVGMLGNTYVINLKLIDIEQAQVLHRVSEKYVGDEAGLIDMMGTTARELFQVSSADKKLPRWITYSLLAAGAVSTAVSYYFYSESEDIYSTDYKNATNGTDEAKYWDQVRDYEVKAGTLLGVGGAFLLGGGITFAF